MNLVEFVSFGRGVLNLINTMAGASFLAMAFNITLIGQVGLPLSLLVIGLMNFVTQDYLARVWLKAKDSLPEDADLPDYLMVYGSQLTENIYNVVIVASMFGTLCFYVIVARTCLEEALILIHGGSAGNYVVVFGAAFGTLVFLFSLVEKIGKQAIFSLFSVAVMVAVLFYVMVQGISSLMDGHRAPYVQPPFDSAALSVIGTLAFAFTSQMNTIPIYNDLLSPSLTKIRVINGISLFSVFAVFCLFGVFGFFCHEGEVPANVLLGRNTHPAILILMMLKVSLTYPLIARPLIVSLDKLNPFANKKGEAWKSHHYVVWICSALVIVVGSVTIGCVFHDISQVTSLVGSLTDGLISFYFPAFLLLHYGMTKKPIFSEFGNGIGAHLMMDVALILTGLTFFGFLDVL